jgi:hypothetical protein
MTDVSRRSFLSGSGNLVAAGAAALSIGPTRADQPSVSPGMVRLRPEIEPVVRWIETTPRERILDVAVEEMRKGLPYRDLLAATFLAGVRNVKPRPVGFKFHTVLVMNSAHQLALDSPEAQRLYPLFWALDHFKDSQEADVKAGDWMLGPVDDKSLPSPGAAAALFTRAMDKWDADAADAAVAQLARSAGAAEIRERFWPFAARNYRNIGHNIIFSAQAFRTLDTIGWQHAEPVLRSLVFGLLDGKPGESSTAPFEPNRALVPSVRKDWIDGKPDPAATAELLDALRSATPADAGKAAARLLDRGASPASLWDAILLGGGELLLRRPGVIALHAVTSMNSMRWAYREAGSDPARLLLLLQAASWVVLFRNEFGQRGQAPLEGGARIDALEPASTEGVPAVDAIFQEMGKDRPRAARIALAYGQRGGSLALYRSAARSFVYRKGTDVHDYKFAAAAFEELGHMPEPWRPHILAVTACHLKPSTAEDSPLYLRIRSAAGRVAT